VRSGRSKPECSSSISRYRGSSAASSSTGPPPRTGASCRGVTLGLVRVAYAGDHQSDVLIRSPLVLLRFRAPEYEFGEDSAAVTWRIERGVARIALGAEPGVPAAVGRAARGARAGARSDRGAQLRSVAARERPLRPLRSVALRAYGASPAPLDRARLPAFDGREPLLKPTLRRGVDQSGSSLG
jgi:hypothetical protein